ncbi:MAG: tetratricopeptide repeat protein [Deltaproteobacteria bacterium]|nr:tetratricopeptide repeat protein [Deltaproteobacteria bacterium]
MENIKDNDKLPKPHGDADYLAVGVLVLLFIALILAGYLAFKSIAGDYDFKTEESAREWIKELEEKARGLLEQTPRLLRKEKRADPRQHLVQGYRLYQQKRYAEAIEAFNRAVRLNAADPEVYYWRGRALVSQGLFEKAVEDFQQAVKLAPRYTEAYDHLGWLFDRLGQFDKGIEAVSRSIELKPDNGWAYYQRGRMLFKTGDKEKALKDAEKSCNLGFREGCNAYESFKSGG